ncbi:MAG TPA: ABC transporter permease subunit [Vicinamibacterales bacterium]|jgi:ABC-type transport system involved in multi-copper enzyme maturation permease subunit
MVLSAIALSVFRESVRDKVFYNLLLFAVLLVGASFLMGQMTAGQDVKIIKDLGLAATSLFGLFIAVFVGIGLVWKEVERRSVYSLIAKPIRRPELVLGKYLGLALTLLCNVVVMAAVLYALLAYMNWAASEGLRRSWEAPAVDPALLKVFLLIYAQLLLVTAIALFFSTFSGPMVAAVLTFGLYVIGHFNADLKHFDAVLTSQPLVWLLRVMYYVLPNLAPFDIKAPVVHGQAVAGGYIAMTLAYAGVYIAVLLVGGAIIFSRRDLK